MTIDARLRRVEERLDIGSRTRPFVLVLSAGPHERGPQYESRLRRRIEETIRGRPKEPFILFMGKVAGP